MKKQLLLLMSAAALFAASCNKKCDVAATPDNTTQTAVKKAVPLTGSLTYHFAPDLNMPCDCGSYYPVGTFYGSGNLSHLGLSTSTIKPCVQPIFSSAGAHLGDHVGVECAEFIAANGDKVFLYTHPYDLVNSGPYASGTCTVDVTGGTGRFAGATGTFTGVVTVHAASGTATFTEVNGTINY